MEGLFVLRIRINEYTDRKWSFCSVYPGIRATKSPVWQNFTKRIHERTTANKKKLRSFFRVSAYPRIGITKTQPQSVNKKNCFEEVRFFGTILWRELKSYQKIVLLTERKKEQARLHARFRRGGSSSAVRLQQQRTGPHQKKSSTILIER